MTSFPLWLVRPSEFPHRIYRCLEICKVFFSTQMPPASDFFFSIALFVASFSIPPELELQHPHRIIDCFRTTTVTLLKKKAG